MNQLITPIAQIPARYPNLINQVRFVGHMSQSEAAFSIWAYKAGLSVSRPCLNVFGSTGHLISQAYRFRNV